MLDTAAHDRERAARIAVAQQHRRSPDCLMTQLVNTLLGVRRDVGRVHSSSLSSSGTQNVGPRCELCVLHQPSGVALHAST